MVKRLITPTRSPCKKPLPKGIDFSQDLFFLLGAFINFNRQCTYGGSTKSNVFDHDVNPSVCTV